MHRRSVKRDRDHIIAIAYPLPRQNNGNRYVITLITTLVLLLGVALILMLIHPATATGDYKTLTQDMENYRPPSPFLSIATDPTGQRTDMPGPIKAAPDPNSEEDTTALTKSVPDSKPFFPQFITLSPELEKRVSHIAGRDNASIGTTVRLLKTSPTLPLLEAIVFKRNPGILAAKKKVTSEKTGFSQVKNLDRILIRYSAFTESLMNDVGPMKGREAVKSLFPFPGLTALKGQATAQSVKMALADLAIAQRDAVIAMRKAYRQSVYLESAAIITRETLTLLKKLHHVADSLYRSGKTSFQDVIKLTIKLNLLEERLVSIHENRRTVQTAMLSLMDLPPDIIMARVRPATPSRRLPQLSPLYDLAMENRQELIKTRAMIGKMERMLKMANTMILPDLDAGFSRFDDHAVTQVGSSAMKPGFATTLPASMGAGTPVKPWLGTMLPWLDQTRQKLISLGHTLENREAQTRKMVRSAWANLDRAIRRARIYGDEIVPLSSKALEVSSREYESGRLSFAEVTASYSSWLQARLAHAYALRDIGIARAELEQIIGVSSF